MLLLGLGGAVGYVMGTRAGRGRYLEMKNMWERAMHEGSLGEMGRKLSETRIGETLGMKGAHSSSDMSGTGMGTSYGAGSTWSSDSGTTTGATYTTSTPGMSTSGMGSGLGDDSITDIREGSDESSRTL